MICGHCWRQLHLWEEAHLIEERDLLYVHPDCKEDRKPFKVFGPLTKEPEMLLALVEVINRKKTDEQTFFRSAYMWAFCKDCDVSNDVAQYKLHAIIPPYVKRYLAHLQQEMM